MPIISGGTAGSSGGGGGEIGYAQITANINVVSTTESAGTTIISPGALTFDGSPVLAQCFATVLTPFGVANETITLCLFEGATQITRLNTTFVSNSAVQEIVTVFSTYRFTPTAGSHTYTVTAFVSSTAGTPAVAAGAGGTGGTPPAFIRFVKV